MRKKDVSVLLLKTALGILILAVAAPAAQAQFTVQLAASLPGGALVGTRVVWQATVENYSGSRPPLFRFEGRLSFGGGDWHLLRDFSGWDSFSWVTLEEGLYDLRVTARDLDSEEQPTAIVSYLIGTRLTGNSPAVVATEHHPLVALYSAPPCNQGTVRVRFRRAAGGFWQNTSPRFCDGFKSLNFHVAGMLANTDYLMQQELQVGAATLRGPVLAFRTGVPAWTFPVYVPLLRPFTPLVPPFDRWTSLTDGVVLHSSAIGGSTSVLRLPVATDLYGNVIWYYDRVPASGQENSILSRPLPGGAMLLILREGLKGQILREIDLAGNVVRETRARNVSEQLEAMGENPIGSFHHEALRLPNGHTVVLASVERILTDVQGPGPVHVVGDMVIDLDQNFQVLWAWNSFDRMDPARAAILGETCVSEGPGCPPLFLGTEAQDWTHSNSIGYSPLDGNLVVSVRHQDWVIKIDYNDGSGSGNVIWRLGRDGDFTFLSNDPWPWFSHQHDAEYDEGTFTIYDNGNTRRAEAANPDEVNSRGQVLLLNEQARVAALVHNFDLGHYAAAVGSAQRLSNGNYHFFSGSLDVDGAPPPFDQAQSLEFLPSGLKSYILLEANHGAYRSFRVQSLYAP